jgi:hypothetical protein
MSQNRTRTHALAAALLVAAGLLLAACGGSSSSSGSDASASDGALKFSRCMREHGVKNFPDPKTTGNGATQLGFKPEGVDSKTMEAAEETCRHFQEEGGPGGEEVSPEQQVEREETVQKFAKCMREHGIEMEASATGGGAQIQVNPGGGGPESPAFKEAQEACEGSLPAPEGGPRAGAAPVEGTGTESTPAE